MSNLNEPLIIDQSMLELFRTEVDTHTQVLTQGLIAIEENPVSIHLIDTVMRAAHSIKGAARLVNVSEVVELAHIMEDFLVRIQSGEKVMCAECADMLLRGVDMICTIAAAIDGKGGNISDQQREVYDRLLDNLRNGLSTSQQNGVAKSKVKKDKEVRSDDLANSVEVTLEVPLHESGDSDSSEECQHAIESVRLLEEAADNHGETRDLSKEKLVEVNLLADPNMMELFRLEVEQQSTSLLEGLLSLEDKPFRPDLIEPLMRAAHSIKGASRLVGLDPAMKLAHLMEDCLVAVQHKEISLDSGKVDILLNSVDMLRSLSAKTRAAEMTMTVEEKDEYARLSRMLDSFLHHKQSDQEEATQDVKTAAISKSDKLPSGDATQGQSAAAVSNKWTSTKNSDKEHKTNAEISGTDRVLRVSAEQLNRLMGLAGESMVEARWLRLYAETLLRLKHRQIQLITQLDKLRECVDGGCRPDTIKRLLREAQARATECRYVLADRMAELESYDRRAINLSSRLHREVVASRMRPFADGVQGFPRMVRDLARSLGKTVQLQIDGHATMVDRDILEKIEASLNHLLRNAIDHGIESPQEREQAGKPAKGTIRLAAYHQSGMLSILLEDDGRGVNMEHLRAKVVERKLVTAEMAANLSEAELMDFIFLPGFSTRSEVTEISGRGVGLDVVHDVVQEMRGMVRATSQMGKGTRFQLQLPLTLSVIPALLVEIAGEPYAFPLARIEKILEIHSDDIREMEGHQYITVENHHIGLVAGVQILGFSNAGIKSGSALPVVVLGERKSSYGVVVDRFLGERDLVVQVLPRLLGKIKDIGAAALMENGVPLLIIDVDDMLRSIEKVVAMGRVSRVDGVEKESVQSNVKRILIVDDSITVREVERKLLEASGYQVEMALDGMDGWNVLREHEFDLVITDIDMPRMDGIELVRMIRQDSKLKDMPIMIVSYKDREDDRIRGLEAGANYYLTKGSFHDETLRDAVLDLIGAAAA